MAAPGLTIRKLADRSTGQRVPTIDASGTHKLVNPDTPGEDHEPWPLAGVRILDDPLPETISLSTNIVAQGRSEGWIEGIGEEVVHRPGGPPGNPWRLTHSLVHLDSIVIHTVDGDVRYEVIRQPDKYAATPGEGPYGNIEYKADDNEEVTDEIYASGNTVVDRFYVMRLVS